MTTATLAGHATTWARVQIPAWGLWYADVELSSEQDLTGSVELVIADLTLSGTILSGGAANDRSRYRIVGGAGGWGQRVDARSYTNEAGVKVRTVIVDAGEAAGETLDEDTLPGVLNSAGPYFARTQGPAARVLQQLVPNAWYMGEDGTTYFGARASADLDVEAARMTTDLARGTIVLAAEQIATILPGITVDGIEAQDVEHSVSADDGLRSTIWGAGVSDGSRRLVAYQNLIDALLPDLKYRGVVEYRIVDQNSERLDLQPVKVSTGMPDLRSVRVRPGVPGFKAEHALGSRVLVAFVDSDPGRPVVVSFEDADNDGFEPVEVFLEAEDTTITTDSLTIEAGPTGAYPWETVTSAEAIVNLINNVWIQIGIQNPGPMTGAAMAGLMPAILNAAIAGAATVATGTIAPFKAAIVAALAAKVPDPTTTLPNIGMPDVSGS
jgi:hypothetical protein